MENRSVVTPADSSSNTSARPVATRTKMILEAPILPTLFRLSVPNVLNLLAFVGLITFDGLFVGRLGADALAGVSLAFPWVMLMQHTAASGMGAAYPPPSPGRLGPGALTSRTSLRRTLSRSPSYSPRCSPCSCSRAPPSCTDGWAVKARY